MGSFLLTDLDGILSEDEFATEVLILLSGVLVDTVSGVFDEEYQDVSPYDASVATLIPAVLIKTSDLVGITTSHTFTINGTAYVAAGPFKERSDGFSLVKLAINI